MLKETMFGNKEIQVVFDKTKDEMEDALNYLYKRAKHLCVTEKKKVAIFLYYTGHGYDVFDPKDRLGITQYHGRSI